MSNKNECLQVVGTYYKLITRKSDNGWWVKREVITVHPRPLMREANIERDVNKILVLKISPV